MSFISMALYAKQIVSKDSIQL